MLQPGVHTEIETIKGYVSVQLEGLRESVYGLTDAQSRLTPCRSTLSIGGLLKHTTYVMAGHVPRRRRQPDGKATDEQWADMAQAFVDSFALREDETLGGGASGIRRDRPRAHRPSGQCRSGHRCHDASRPVGRPSGAHRGQGALRPRASHRRAGPSRGPRRHHPGADRRRRGGLLAPRRRRTSRQSLHPALEAAPVGLTGARSRDGGWPAHQANSASRAASLPIGPRSRRTARRN